MKKFFTMMVLVAILMMGTAAHGEVTPADMKALSETKVFQTEGVLKGTWTVQFTRNEDNLYPCALDLGDGRIIIVPLTDDEVNDLMLKALEEHNAKVKAEEKVNANPSVPARVLDWITFWDN